MLHPSCVCRVPLGGARGSGPCSPDTERRRAGAASWPLAAGDTARIGPVCKRKAHAGPDPLSTWSHDSAPIYFLYRQASVKTLPRFEGVFDTIVSSSSTFNCWSENLPSESHLAFFNLCHLLFKFPSNLVSSEDRIKLSCFLGMHRLCDKIYKQFWSSVKFTATQYCSFN